MEALAVEVHAGLADIRFLMCAALWESSRIAYGCTREMWPCSWQPQPQPQLRPFQPCSVAIAFVDQMEVVEKLVMLELDSN